MVAFDWRLRPLYDAPALEGVGVLGGLLTPVLMRSESDQYSAFLLYLALFDAGVLLLALWRPWPAVTTLAFVGTQLWLYYGNPGAEPPQYDCARNLPAALDPPPARLTLAEQSQDPHYQPEPLPLNERWPWLIHVILGTISLGLTPIIVRLAQTAIRFPDAQVADASESSP